MLPADPETIAKKPNYILWILSGVVGLMFTVVIALIIIGVNLIVSSSKNINFNQQPAPVIEPAPIVINQQSKFATDAGVLKLRNDLTKLQSDIDSTDIFEAKLSPPNLDLNIRIQSTN